MKKHLLAIVILGALLSMVFGCKDELSETGQVMLHLIHAPATYDAVVLVVREVSVHSESYGWIVVNNTARTFDLPRLTNGVRSVLGEATLGAGRYNHIRLLLDSDSYVAVRNMRHALVVEGGLGMQIDLDHQFQIAPNLPNQLYLDFDANGSACICECCRQFKPALHVYASLESLAHNATRRLKASKGLERCKCSGRWDHREQTAQHCRHCTLGYTSVSVIEKTNQHQSKEIL